MKVNIWLDAAFTADCTIVYCLFFVFDMTAISAAGRRCHMLQESVAQMSGKTFILLYLPN